MAYLVKTSIDELAELTDDLFLNDKIVFSTEDPNELEKYGLFPYKYNLIYKSKLLHEKYFVITIGEIAGHCTVAKDIYILSHGNVDDEESRINGVKEFLTEYYEKYMDKNKDGYIYLVKNP